jgi:hypothetical protein
LAGPGIGSSSAVASRGGPAGEAPPSSTSELFDDISSRNLTISHDRQLPKIFGNNHVTLLEQSAEPLLGGVTDDHRSS